MPSISPDVINHRLSISPNFKPIRQKRWAYDAERYEAMWLEVEKLQAISFIREAIYPIWLANSVLVKKSNGAWQMCQDYTNMNKACTKDSYTLPRIDQLVDATAGHELLSFMDVYSGYNQIFMNPADREHTTFITNKGLYCYDVMPFSLKNAGATYQRLVNQIFAELMGTCIEVYVDDMLVKSRTADRHLHRPPSPKGPLWTLYVDGSSNQQGCGAGLVQILLNRTTIEYAIWFEFKTSDNEAEYAALLSSLWLAKVMGVEQLWICSDSQLVVNRVNTKFEAKDASMAAYLAHTRRLLSQFGAYQIQQIPRSEKSKALSRLASTIDDQVGRDIPIEVLARQSTTEVEIHIIWQNPSWIDPIHAYLTDGMLSTDKIEAQVVCC
ncbi:hypothetical protein L3X38_011484 [Prunus dulcis]|uniref:RNase H type-1 domain-containing protein n=1 Tax=Prunus dulcis TaxID=3755 RepID=A0AAD4WHG6_PRUDU|nr:hypothetical protein L3X38_011484 [Prunus dulcis]